MFKTHMLKEVLKKSGMSDKDEVATSMARAISENNFLYELKDNEIIKFVTWYPNDNETDKILINNLWIDPKYRNKNSILKIRTLLRNMYKGKRGIWFNRKKQKLVERI